MARLFLIILLLSGEAIAGDTDSTTSIKITDKSASGIAAHIGAGGLYGGAAGASVEYQFVLNPTLRLTPLVSVGSVMGTDSTDAQVYDFGYCFGINMEFGKMHRFFIGSTFGTLLIDEGLNKDSTYITNTVIGPSLDAGLKWTTGCGFLWEISVGMGYGLNNKVDSELNDRVPGFSASLAPTLNLGLGYKF